MSSEWQFPASLEIRPCVASRILTAALVLSFVATVRADDPDAKPVAQEVLDKGAALFDKRDAVAMAETYTQDAQLEWVEKDSAAGGIKIEVRKGREEIECFIGSFSRT